MCLVTGLAKAVAFVRVVMGLGRDAVVLQRLEHVAGLLRHDYGVEFALEENYRHADLVGV